MCNHLWVTVPCCPNKKHSAFQTPTFLDSLCSWEEYCEDEAQATVRNKLYIFICNRPLLFISLLHSDNRSEMTTKFYNSSKVDVGGNVPTLTLCVLKSDWTESVWMPTDLVKFPVHSICLLRKKLQHLADCCHYSLSIFFFLGEPVWCGGGVTIRTCEASVHDPPMCVRCVCVCVCVFGVCMHTQAHMCVCEHACRWLWVRECLCFSMCQFHFALHD